VKVLTESGFTSSGDSIGAAEMRGGEELNYRTMVNYTIPPKRAGEDNTGDNLVQWSFPCPIHRCSQQGKLQAPGLSSIGYRSV